MPGIVPGKYFLGKLAKALNINGPVKRIVLDVEVADVAKIRVERFMCNDQEAGLLGAIENFDLTAIPRPEDDCSGLDAKLESAIGRIVRRLSNWEPPAPIRRVDNAVVVGRNHGSDIWFAVRVFDAQSAAGWVDMGAIVKADSLVESEDPVSVVLPFMSSNHCARRLATGTSPVMRPTPDPKAPAGSREMAGGEVLAGRAGNA